MQIKKTYFGLLFVLVFSFISKPIFAGESPQFVPGQLIVKYKQGKKQLLKQQYTSLIQSENPLIKNRSPKQDPFFDQFSLINVPAGKEEEIISKLKSNPDVEYVERDGIYITFETPNDPFYHQQWAYSRGSYVNLESIWSQSVKNTDGIIAIIDTGVDVAHEDLKNRIWINPNEIAENGIDDDGNGKIDDVNGWNTVVNTGEISDDFGHGTQVAGVAAASSNNGMGIVGAAWEGKIMIVKANNAHSGIFNYSEIDEALAYVSLFPQVQIINLSLGGYSLSLSQKDIINTLLSNNKIVVAAAGNDMKDYKTNPMYPAAIKGVIATASHDSQNFSSFSNYGYRIDITAPGSSIYTTYAGGDYGYATGTSFSAPLVAGEALLFLQHYPDFTAKEVLQAVRSWASCPLDNPSCTKPYWDKKWGYGRLSGFESINHRCGEEDPVRSTVYISEPDDRATIQTGQSISIKGTVKSNKFQSYSIQWGRGDNPTVWSTDGIVLTNQGEQQVENGVLGTLDMSKFLSSDFYLIRIVASGSATCLNNVVGEDRTGIFVKRVFSISGKITNLNKQPAAGVYVQFYQNNSGVGWVQINTSGVYVKNNLSAGTYSWVPSLGKEAYIPSSRSAVLLEGQPDFINQDFVQQLWSPSPTPMPTPRPTSTPTPTPTPTPTSTPTPTLKPRPTSTPTPTPKPPPPQFPPVIETTNLPRAYVGRPYATAIVATDKNRDKIKLGIEGIPLGLQKGFCINIPGFTSCLVYGIPRKRGLYSIQIVAQDTTSRITKKTLPLIVW